ncbi:MAG TPA: N-acetylglucosamine-6-phosphate deacetylase [Alphaproteobacteria bacterium]|nr:N-acetylglucosamine-6-phosphate deacetylase [Alphaproteobacteria bacterium]
MSSSICIHNATVLNGFTTMKNCAVFIKENKIVDVFNEERFLKKSFDQNTVVIDAKGAYLTPGLIDTHIHGIKGYGVEDEEEKSILKMSEALVEFGVTSFIPTLYTQSKNKMLKSIKAIAKAMGKEKGARILGMHLEGPFISKERLGVQKEEDVLAPSIPVLDEFLEAAQGHIINMTVAPEIKGMRELALYALSKGIVLQAGHTNATYAQMIEAMQARIFHVTHLFNAMSRMHHRDPGVVGAVFIHPELSCEIIADGIHINPEIIKFLLTCKSLDKVVLVTDSLKPTKQTKKPLIANGEEVYLDKCFYRKSDDAIAGSALTMIDSVKNIVSYGFHLEQAIHMAATNPARIMRQEHLGVIAPGYDADLVLLSEKLSVLYTIIQGKIFEKGKPLCV